MHVFQLLFRASDRNLIYARARTNYKFYCYIRGFFISKKMLVKASNCLFLKPPVAYFIATDLDLDLLLNFKQQLSALLRLTKYANGIINV